MSLPSIDMPIIQKSKFSTRWPFAETEEVPATPIMVRERLMMNLTAALKDKPRWEEKVLDEDIVSRYKKEAIEGIGGMKLLDDTLRDNPRAERLYGESEGTEKPAFESSVKQRTVTGKLFDTCIDELQAQAEASKKNGFTEIFDANVAVYISDKAISEEAKMALRTAVSPLEDVHEEQKDWHPDSEGKVLDIVHPSLFPLMYGRSRYLPDGNVPLTTCSAYCGRGELVPAIKRGKKTIDRYYSMEHQWLPCDVAVDENGNCKIESYINNLHPAGNEKLYTAIEHVITKAFPMWKSAWLSCMFSYQGHRIELEDDGYDKFLPDGHGPRRHDGGDHESPEDDDTIDDYDEVCGAETTWDEESSRLDSKINKDGLQVIVKLANIELTPEKPTFKGGSWHIEGLENEHICASALYYYDSENVTASFLAFRENVDTEPLIDRAGQDEFNAITEIYGIMGRNGAALQVLGQVRTKEDRLLVFPNVLQHRVSPFALADPTKSGHRKLLALFWVDPDIRIPSTANVPPQNRDWWAREIHQSRALPKLPVELADLCIDGVDDFPLSLEEAKKVRLELMKERGAKHEEVRTGWVNSEYYFCEH